MDEKMKKYYTSQEETIEKLKLKIPYFRLEDCRTDVVRQGSEFALPQSAMLNSMDALDGMLAMNDLKTPDNIRRDYRDGNTLFWKEKWEALNEANPQWEEWGFWKEYEVSGCVEEPDAPKVHVVVRHLKEEYKHKPYPTVFVVPQGGLCLHDPYLSGKSVAAKFFGCQMVIVQYRSNVDAKYPAAINDLHAVYQWMADHASELNVDMDRIVIYGASSGGHLASAFAFRLKRYDWCGAPMPRGVVVDDGFFDDRETTRSMRMLNLGWSGMINRLANMLYMGDNFASGFVGPEAYPNHATVNECKGLPPFHIYIGQDNCGCDPAIEFVLKLNEAGVYCSYYMLGGTTHSRPVREDGANIMAFSLTSEESEFVPRKGCDATAVLENYIVGGIYDFLYHDVRRNANIKKENVTSANEYDGIYVPEEQTIDELKEIYSYYRIEEGRDDFVRQGNAYAHPQCKQQNTLDIMEALFAQQNIQDSQETRKKVRDDDTEFWKSQFERKNEDNPQWGKWGYWEEYEVDGCVEELDAPKVHVLMRRLRDNFAQGPYPTLFVIPTGGLIFNSPWNFASAPLAEYLKCQIIVPEFRSTCDAKYPAAVNDLHAVYQWMVEHASELNVDLDRVVVYGTSSGGHLAAALPFRLKRYNWCGGSMVRGVVVDDGFFDDRETTRSMRTLAKTWCGLTNRAANMLYMGENFASGFIGPEAYANHATVEECKGLPPYQIYEGQDNCGCDPGLEFTKKLNEAGVFCSFLMCGGANHIKPTREGESAYFPVLSLTDISKFEPHDGFDGAAIIENYIVGAIQEFFQSDLRRC